LRAGTEPVFRLFSIWSLVVASSSGSGAVRDTGSIPTTSSSRRARSSLTSAASCSRRLPHCFRQRAGLESREGAPDRVLGLRDPGGDDGEIFVVVRLLGAPAGKRSASQNLVP